MKKIFLLTLFSLLIPIVASAYDAYINGIYYNFSGNEAIVTCRDSNRDNASYSGTVIIPELVQYNNKTYRVTSIGDYAFHDCHYMSSVSIPKNVTNIGSYAFYSCFGLSSITIPNSVTSIGEGAFSLCVILTSVKIPNSVTSISRYAFRECYKLTSVTIPNSVTSIGFAAFRGCDGLSSVTIPNSVTSIGSDAFSSCTSLTSITIPESVTSIDSGAFSYCNSLTSIKVDTGNAIYDSRNDCNSIIETATNKLIAGCQNTIIPNSVTSIGNSAFKGCNSLTSIAIPNSVTSISEYAFYDCRGLTSVTIPNNVTSIGQSTFYNCSGLISVTIPNTVTNIGNYAFQNCTSLTAITIPSSVSSIGYNAFHGCSGLTKVILQDIASWCGISFVDDSSNPLYYAQHIFSDEGTEITDLIIPEGVISIGNYAFYNCNNINSITIPESLTSIGSSSFEGCYNLKRMNIVDVSAWCKISLGDNPLIRGAKLYLNGQPLIEAIIPDGITKISDGLFYGCTDLTSVTIPTSVTGIGNYAFYNCRGLTSISIPEGVTSIGHTVFYDCSSLKSVNIPNGLTSIDRSTFSGCSSLTSISIPEGVTSIGEDAFDNCSNLTSINIPSGVTSIGSYTFRNCKSLTSIIIPSGVTGINSSTFYGCCSLTSVNIPNGVTRIGNNAFYGCTALVHVTLESNAIVSSSRMKSIFGEQVKEYVLGNSIKSIGGYAFSGCNNLTSIIIPESVTNIGEYAFRDCDLRNVLVKCPTPPTARENTFTNQTYSHTILYVPTGTWDAYAYDKAWYKFNNIRETATAEGQLSMQQAYTLMDANKFTYSVYDMVNNCVSTTNADGIDENNPNHSWQLMKANGKHYLYNIGAKKYVQKNGSSFDLIDTPRPINVENGDNGIILGTQTSQQWALVCNEHVNVLQSAIDEITSIGTKVDMAISNAGYSTFYDSRYAYTLPNGLSAQVVTNASNGKLTYSTIAEGNTAGIVPKGTAVMLVSDSKRSGTYSLTVTAENTPYSGTNLLRGSDEATMTSGNGLHYKLSYGQTGTKWNDVFGWYWGAQNGAPFQIEGHKAWLVVSGGSTRAAGFTIDGDATEIIDIASDSEEYDIYYDIQGRRISTPTRSGLYIKNGKKVIIK